MHILIAFLTALASVLYAMDRLGIDIGWLNPWAWRRRRRWMKQVQANPAFSLKSPMEAMALLLLATAKIDGDLSSDEKNELRSIFEEAFKQSPDDASSLLNASSYLLGSSEEVFQRSHDVLAPCLEYFDQAQRESSLELLERISKVGGPASDSQLKYIESIRSALYPEKETKGWH